MSLHVPGTSTDLPPSFAGRRVLVLGDVMLDRYVFGAVERISPEAPIPVLRMGHRRATLGGAGNVANNIAALGGTAVLLGIIGDDEAGSDVLAAVSAAGQELGGAVEPGFLVLAGRATTVKTRFIAGNQQLLRLDEEVRSPLAPQQAEELVELYRTALADCDVVILSDYAKGTLDARVLRTAIDLAREASKPVIADPKSTDFTHYRGVDVLKPNRGEIARATQIEMTDDASAERAARQASTMIGGGAILLSRSEQGALLVASAGPALLLRARARQVADVSGAGDTLVATLALAMASGVPLSDAAFIANVAAGISVGKLGTAIVSHTELAEALHLGDLLAIDRKILDPAAAMQQAAAWRAQGLAVGFTNGCFDLIHPGHVSLLTQARNACDRLIVGINTDASVKRLKGPTRPVQNEVARATVMASLAAVDLVVPFAEDTPIDLIEKLRPDVLVKGADYRVDQVVGADFVQGYGGRVLLVDLVEGQSTTSTIARLK